MAYQSHLPTDTLLKQTYQIERMLASGGFGITYLARHTLMTNKQFVIKEFFLNGVCIRVSGATVQAESAQTAKFETYKAKFLEEAMTIASLPDAPHNPHLVKVLDFFYENNTAYMVMPYIQGVDLERFTQMQPSNRLPEPEALDYIRQAAEGLQTAHQQNILHRDIKPSNLMRQPNGQIVIIDFGAAREFISIEQSQSMSVIYTPGYAPIEQYSVREKRGDYTDIYALGATLYRLLTGQTPSDAVSLLRTPLTPPKTLNPAVSDATNGLVLKMMANHAENRFQNIKSLLAAMNNDYWVDEPILVEDTVLDTQKNDIVTPPKPKKVASKKIATIGLLLIGMMTAAIIWLNSSKTPQIIGHSKSTSEPAKHKSTSEPAKEALNYDEMFTDKRDGKIYGLKLLNGKKWINQNMDYNVSGSIDGNDTSYRLYTFSEASKACPTGFHLASKKEWVEMIKAEIHRNYDGSDYYSTKDPNCNINLKKLNVIATGMQGYQSKEEGVKESDIGNFWTSTSPYQIFFYPLDEGERFFGPSGAYHADNRFGCRCVKN